MQNKQHMNNGPSPAFVRVGLQPKLKPLPCPAKTPDLFLSGCCRCLSFFRFFSDHGFGGQHQACDRCGILNRKAHDFSGVNHTRC